MNNLETYLYEKRKQLKGEVEAELPPARFVNDTMNELVDELVRRYPMCHGGIDKTHIIWARCLRDLLWLGWVSEAKKRRTAYSRELCNALEQNLRKAFEIGKEHAIEQP